MDWLKRFLKIGEYSLNRLGGMARSVQWPVVRKTFLKDHPSCAVCGRTHGIAVHHVVPFSRDKSKELEPSNFIPLCEGLLTKNDHLRFGHLDSWKSFNENVRIDAEEWRQKILNRPK
jgi:hypothetical protein